MNLGSVEIVISNGNGSVSPPLFSSGLGGFRGVAVPDRAALESGSVARIIHGAHDLLLPVAGRTVGEIRYGLETPLNLHPDASAYLDRRYVEGESNIQDGSTLEFLLLRGQKGVGRVWKNLEEICEVFGLNADRLGQWRQERLPVHEFKDGSILLTESDFDLWSSTNLGLVKHPASSGRLPEDADLDAHYLSIKSAAKLTTLSQSHIRRAVRSGDLTASNVGSPSHPIWRIKRDDLEGWMKRRSGGNPKVPPDSHLNDLIKRHLPRL